MIRYGYNQQLDPPAPFVHVTLRCCESGKEVANLPAQLDTAADRTVIPGKLVAQLSLVQLDELPVAGFGGQVLLVLTYRIELTVRGLQPLTIEVLSHPEEPFVLLGRDVLNQYRTLLDGPKLGLEMD